MNELLPNRIRHFRHKNGYTLEEFASKIGVSRSTLANYENGTTEAKMETLNNIAKELGVSIDELIISSNFNLAKNKINGARSEQKTDLIAFNFLMNELVSLANQYALLQEETAKSLDIPRESENLQRKWNAVADIIDSAVSQIGEALNVTLYKN